MIPVAANASSRRHATSPISWIRKPTVECAPRHNNTINDFPESLLQCRRRLSYFSLILKPICYYERRNYLSCNEACKAACLRFRRTALWTVFQDSEIAECLAQADMETMLHEFADVLCGYCHEENDLIKRMRTLCYVRAELSVLAPRRLINGAGKKCVHSVPYRLCS